MLEASKAASRRGNPYPYISGKVLDIGCGPNPISELYSGITEFKGWDIQDGDAQYLRNCKNNYYDCVHSSHSLEHMVDPIVSLRRWVEVTAPNGYLVITVPDEEMYEQFHWPSRFNGDHKWSFTTHSGSRMPKSVNVLDMIRKLKGIQLVSLLRVEDGFNKSITYDQTRGPAECCIEFILRKCSK